MLTGCWEYGKRAQEPSDWLSQNNQNVLFSGRNYCLNPVCHVSNSPFLGKADYVPFYVNKIPTSYIYYEFILS